MHSLNWVIITSASLPEVLPSQLLPFLIVLTVIAFMTQATILQKLFVLDKTLVLKRRSNSDRADNMTNGLKGMRLKDVKNKEFPKGRYVGIILWSHVCYSTCFKPTQFQSKVSPRFGTNLYITEITKEQY